MSGKLTVQSYGHSTESNTLYSTNHSVQNHFSTNQNAWIPHDDGVIRSLHGTNRTVTTSHSYENESKQFMYCNCTIIHVHLNIDSRLFLVSVLRFLKTFYLVLFNLMQSVLFGYIVFKMLAGLALQGLGMYCNNNY